MTISDFLSLVKKKIHVIIIFALIAGIAAGIFSWGIMTNDYTSSVSLYVLQTKEETKSNVLNSSDVVTSQQLSNDIAVLVKSNRVNDAVTRELGVDNLDNYDIKVTSNEKNRVINISVTGKNPNSVAQVVNSIARQTSALAVEIMKVEAVNIIEEAQPSTIPSGPHRLLITLIAIFVGIFLAIVLIIISDMLDTTVKNKNDIKNLLDTPLLAQVPYIKKLK